MKMDELRHMCKAGRQSVAMGTSPWTVSNREFARDAIDGASQNPLLGKGGDSDLHFQLHPFIGPVRGSRLFVFISTGSRPRLLPLNRGRRLRRDVIHHAVDSL